MPISDIPGVYFDEEVTYEVTGEGSKIPVFIGRTGNAATQSYVVDGSVIRKFESWEEVKQPTTESTPGIGEPTATNVLSKAIKEFYDEARLVNSTDIGVAYIYVIDVGTGTNLSVWERALKTAKQVSEAQVEVYVGIENIVDDTSEEQTPPAVSIPAFLNGAYTELERESHELDLRYGFTTKLNASSDADLIALTNETTGIRKSRIGICEPLLFGKTIARICCTPSNTEPGYLVYRSVEPGDFKRRSREEATALQNAGIIFNRDEHITNNIYPRMNLCVATSFASTQKRPADALFHARFNADALLREIFEDCYSQIKANESTTNIAYLQTRINKRVNDKVSAEEMVKYNERTGYGTKLVANASDSNPYSVVITGQIQPVKCTIAIDVQATIKV